MEISYYAQENYDSNEIFKYQLLGHVAGEYFCKEFNAETVLPDRCITVSELELESGIRVT